MLSLDWKAVSLPIQRQELSTAVDNFKQNLDGYDMEFQGRVFKAVLDGISLEGTTLRIRQAEARFFSKDLSLKKRVRVGPLETTVETNVHDLTVVARIKKDSRPLEMVLPPRIALELRRDGQTVVTTVRNEAELRAALEAEVAKTFSDENLSDLIEIDFENAPDPLRPLVNVIAHHFRSRLQEALRAKLKEELGQPSFVTALISPLQRNVPASAIPEGKTLGLELRMAKAVGELLQLRIGDPEQAFHADLPGANNLRVSSNTAFLQMAVREAVRAVVNGGRDLRISEQTTLDAKKQLLTIRPKDQAEAEKWVGALNTLLHSEIQPGEVDSIGLSFAESEFPRFTLKKMADGEKLTVVCLLKVVSTRESDIPLSVPTRLELKTDRIGNWYLDKAYSPNTGGDGSSVFALDEIQKAIKATVVRALINQNLSALQEQQSSDGSRLGFRIESINGLQLVAEAVRSTN